MGQLVIPRPFLKWVGGKSQLADQLLERIPAQFGAYHEPFVGGGALFFALYRAGLIHKAYLSDANRELIDAYIAVRDHTDEILDRLAKYRHTEKFFYQLRERNPWRMRLPNRAARMIFLNKTCYNGLYRVNSKGKFNAPFGRYKNPNYRDPDNLYAVAEALQHVCINNAPFESILDRAIAGDLVYFDPPYVPLSATANFTGYHRDGFTHEDQMRLRDVAQKLLERSVYVLLSNSATEIVHELYAGECFQIDTVFARRNINSNPEKRGKLSELIIIGQPLKEERGEKV